MKLELSLTEIEGELPNLTVGSLSNDDGDDHENGEKAIGSDKQCNNIARTSQFFVSLIAVVARLRLETSWSYVSWRT